MDPKDDSQLNLDELISLDEAARLSGLSHPHLTFLVRRGKLWGKKIGRNWITTRKALSEYLEQDHRPGPKPKRS